MNSVLVPDEYIFSSGGIGVRINTGDICHHWTPASPHLRQTPQCATGGRVKTSRRNCRHDRKRLGYLVRRVLDEGPRSRIATGVRLTRFVTHRLRRYLVGLGPREFIDRNRAALAPSQHLPHSSPSVSVYWVDAFRSPSATAIRAEFRPS